MPPLKKALVQQVKTEKWLANIVHVQEKKINAYCTGQFVFFS